VDHWLGTIDLTNSKIFLTSTKNCHLKVKPWQKKIMD